MGAPGQGVGGSKQLTANETWLWAVVTAPLRRALKGKCIDVFSVRKEVFKVSMSVPPYVEVEVFFQWRSVTVCNGLRLSKKMQIPRNFPEDWEFPCNSLDVCILLLLELLLTSKEVKRQIEFLCV